MARVTLTELLAHCLGALLVAGIVAAFIVTFGPVLHAVLSGLDRRISRWADQEAPRDG